MSSEPGTSDLASGEYVFDFYSRKNYPKEAERDSKHQPSFPKIKSKPGTIFLKSFLMCFLLIAEHIAAFLSTTRFFNVFSFSCQFKNNLGRAALFPTNVTTIARIISLIRNAYLTFLFFFHPQHVNFHIVPNKT